MKSAKNILKEYILIEKSIAKILHIKLGRVNSSNFWEREKYNLKIYR